jgi:hypothetical protein
MYFPHILMLIVDCVPNIPSLIISEGEENNNEDHNAKDVAATANVDNDEEENDDEDHVNDDATMPPKVKPVTAAASKTAEKKKKADEIALLPAPKLPDIRTYSIEAEDPFTISYYANGKHDYTNVVIRVNGTMEGDGGEEVPPPKWTVLGKATGGAPEMEVHRNPHCHQ